MQWWGQQSRRGVSLHWLMVESGNLYTKPISSEKEFEMEISCRRRVGTAEGACGAFHRKTKR
jgi:hypothetical protein